MPFTLIGQTVEVTRRGGRLQHRPSRRASWPSTMCSPGKYQVHILPEHGPGAVARTRAARARRLAFADSAGARRRPRCEIRDLAIYETLAAGAVSA